MTTTTLLKRISIFAELGLKNPRLIALLTKTASEYREVESAWESFLREFNFAHNAHFTNRTLSSTVYFEKNFFSILLLSILKSAQIPKYRRLKYGLLLQALRTIVTCTDNILDHEQKGAVQLETNLHNPVLDNVLLTLAAQKVLLCASCSLCSEPYGTERLQKRLLDSLSRLPRVRVLPACCRVKCIQSLTKSSRRFIKRSAGNCSGWLWLPPWKMNLNTGQHWNPWNRAFWPSVPPFRCWMTSLISLKTGLSEKRIIWQAG